MFQEAQLGCTWRKTGYKAEFPEEIHIASRLKYAKQNRNKPLEQNWRDESKMKLFVYNHKFYILRGVNEAYNEKCTLPTMTHGGSLLLSWGCVNYQDTGNMVKIDGKMNATAYQKISEENLRSSAQKLCMGHIWMFQQDNPPLSSEE